MIILQISPLASGPAASSNTAHHSYHQPPRPSPDSVSAVSHTPQPQQTSQPVEFNHAINYVNKIKVGFVITITSFQLYTEGFQFL